MLKHFSGMKIIESNFCYETKSKVRGLADRRRTNTKKPLYRRVTVKIPTMYMVAGNIVGHPERVAQLVGFLTKPAPDASPSGFQSDKL